MNLSRTLIAASGVLVAGLIVVAATGQNQVGCAIRAVSQSPPDAEAATLEFRIDRMIGQSIRVTRAAAERPAWPSVVRTRTTSVGAIARCGSAGGRNTHFVIEPIAPAPKAEFQGEGPVRVVVIGDGVELASGMVSAAQHSEIKLTW